MFATVVILIGVAVLMATAIIDLEIRIRRSRNSSVIDRIRDYTN